MSDIKVGDLVMRIKPLECCGITDLIGVPFVVSEISILKTRCKTCGNISNECRAYDKDNNKYPLLSRLIKIDPPALDETTESERKLTV